uniref:Gamma-glutamylcyclotransferase n=1 Tax=Panagrolaimus sp. JU765 TaxID=591449 RepID=A0AC34QRE9_9BILA
MIFPNKISLIFRSVPVLSSHFQKSKPKMYVFGYGSLLWYTDFPFVEAIPGVVPGYARRFWQLSPDHRGNELSPGRVVTLIPDATSQTWGLAYKVPDEAIESTFAYLNFRERAGYRCEQVQFYPDNGGEPFLLHVYISLEGVDNPYYTGPTEMEEIVSTIVKSRGKSGSNLEYALRLAHCQRKMAPHIQDDHLFELEKKLLEACIRMQVEDNILRLLGYDLPYLTAAAEKCHVEDLLPVMPLRRLELTSESARG